MLNKHYIQTDAQDRIVSGWSERVFPYLDITNAIVIHESGGYQFRLWPGGEENPSLTNPDGTHRYIYDPSLSPAYREATAEELAAERAEIEAAREPPGATAEDILGRQITQLTLNDMQKDQAINALGAQLVQLSLEIINLKGSAL